MKTISKYYILLLIFILFISNCLSNIFTIKIYANDFNEQAQITKEGLNIFYYPLGSDTGETYESYIIAYNDIQILVDAGASWHHSSPESSNIIVEKLEQVMGDDKDLDYVIVTHADSDHIAGFSTKGENGVFDYCLENDISVGTLIDFDITQDDTVTFDHKDEYFLENSNLGNKTIYGRYVSARKKLVENGTVYYTASQCCWIQRQIDKPQTAPDSNIFVLDSGVLTLEILYNHYYDHRFNEIQKVSSMDRNVLSVCFLLTYNTKEQIKTFLFTGDLEEYDSSSGVKPSAYSDEELDESNDFEEDTLFDELEGQDYSVKVEGESKLWEYLSSDSREQLLKSNSAYIYYDITKGVTFFKAAHHGSRTSNSREFIDNIRPCYVVIPCVAGSNQYTNVIDDQFPAKVVLNRLFKYTDYIYITELAVNSEEGKTISATAYYGEIHLNCCDGKIVVETSNNEDVLIQDTTWFQDNRFAPLNVFSFSSVISESLAYIGNCNLVKYGHTDILIDCGVYGTIGDNAMLTTCFIDKVEKYCVDGILEYVIITSASPTSLQQMVDLTSNKENIPGILTRFNIENLIDYGNINDPTGSAEKSLYKAYNILKNSLTKNGTKYYSAPVYAGNNINIQDNLSISILKNKNYQKSIDYDVCLTINYLDKRLLFTGSITNDTEKYLVSNNDLSNIVYYKTAFFGYNDSSSELLLNTIKNDRLYIVINTIANKTINGYKILSRATCDRIINTSAKHYSYLTAEYRNGKNIQVCGDITFSVYLSNNTIKYSLKGSNSSQRLCDTEYYRKSK